jgi:hypothetical protein
MGTTTPSVFPFRIGPLNNIQPFTYRDGMSHLQLLEKLRVYINDNLRGEFNDELDRVITEFNQGMEVQEGQFNTAFAAFVATVNASVMAINNRVGPEAVQHITLSPTPHLLEIDPVWPDNQHIMVDVLQDATGGRTITLGDGITGPLELDPAPNARTVFTLVPVSGGTWRIQENSYTFSNLLTTLATKLSSTTAAATYLTITDAGTTYKTQASATADRSADQSANLTKASATLLYPTKQNVVDGLSPDRRAKVRGGKTAFLGDSYASGVGPSTLANRWTSRYAGYSGFVESNHAVSSSGYVNEGVGGASRFASQAANIPLDTDRVIVCGGINDTSFTVSQIANGVTETIGAIRTRVPNAEIVILSPMWWNVQPSDAMLSTEAVIRNNVPSDIRFVEGGLWLRQNRADTANAGDGGHPTDIGSILIARWVQAKLENTGPGGAVEAAFDRNALFDDEVVTSITSGVGLAGGTIYAAKPGKWRLTGYLSCYGDTDGFLWLEIAGQRIVKRGGVQNSKPQLIEWSEDVRHQGGDVLVQLGITFNSPTNILEVGTKIRAEWISD